MLLRLPVTVMPVLGGPVAGETVTVKSVLPPGSRELGVAVPLADREFPLRRKCLSSSCCAESAPFTVKSFELLSVSWQPF